MGKRRSENERTDKEVGETMTHLVRQSWHFEIYDLQMINGDFKTEVGGTEWRWTEAEKGLVEGGHLLFEDVGDGFRSHRDDDFGVDTSRRQKREQKKEEVAGHRRTVSL